MFIRLNGWWAQMHQNSILQFQNNIRPNFDNGMHFVNIPLVVRSNKRIMPLNFTVNLLGQFTGFRLVWTRLNNRLCWQIKFSFEVISKALMIKDTFVSLCLITLYCPWHKYWNHVHCICVKMRYPPFLIGLLSRKKCQNSSLLLLFLRQNEPLFKLKLRQHHY